MVEVNLSPSLATDAPIDLKIKSNVIADFLNIMGLEVTDPLSRRKAEVRSNSNLPYSRKNHSANSNSNNSHSQSQPGGPLSQDDAKERCKMFEVLYFCQVLLYYCSKLTVFRYFGKLKIPTSIRVRHDLELE